MKKAFVFPGQGSQVVGMGKDFYDNFPVAKQVFDEVDEVLGQKLSDVIFNGPAEDLTATQNTQPALMCVSIAILRALEQESGKKIGDLCSFIAGHSLGEYSALCAGGAMSLADTAKLLRIRGNAFAKAGEQGKGSMAAIIGLSIEDVETLAKKASSETEVCQVANDNSVGQVVISGHEAAIDRAVEIAKEMGAKRALKLPVSGAFHSELMMPAAKVMEEALAQVNITIPSIPLIANVTAQQVQSESDIRNSLVRQVTGQVKWRETMLKFATEGVEEVVEIGAGKVLSGLVTRTCPDLKAISINSIEGLKGYLL